MVLGAAGLEGLLGFSKDKFTANVALWMGIYR